MDLFSNWLKLLTITISQKGIKKRATGKVTHFGKNQNEYRKINIIFAICQEKFEKFLKNSRELVIPQKV